jgi:hypothetical protein
MFMKCLSDQYSRSPIPQMLPDYLATCHPETSSINLNPALSPYPNSIFCFFKGAIVTK